LAESRPRRLRLRAATVCASLLTPQASSEGTNVNFAVMDFVVGRFGFVTSRRPQ
jgi:hypothetical protein